MDYKARRQSWLDDPAIDELTKSELVKIKDEKEIEDRFYKDLDFGTAGLRGVIGTGTNRMNVYIVGRATEGLARYLLTVDGAAQKGVAIAFDSRYMSAEFARRAALVLCANGIKAYLFSGLRAVPQLSFAIGHLGCAAGIVITASHNPKQYNGFKVYGANGAQINPEMAAKITENIISIEHYGEVKLMDQTEALKSGILEVIGEKVDEAYYAYTSGLVVDKAVMEGASKLKIVYTPLFGSGNIPVTRVLSDAGIHSLYVIKQQQFPNGEFPGLTAPNPEDPKAFEIAAELAVKVGAHFMLATDPDADRLGVCVRDGDSFVTLSGNQIGCLILHYRLMKLKEQGRLPENGLVVKSIVSSNFANAICDKFGVELSEVLTGFRFIGEKIDECEKTGEKAFLFGFEESYGFLAGTRVRDKDAICASLMLSEVAAYYNERGMTLYDGLVELFEEFGYYEEDVTAFTLYGKEGMEKIAAAMKYLRDEPPSQFANYPVVATRDYKTRTRTTADEQQPIALPPSDVLYYELGKGDWLCVRPSGTEPKLKVYAGCSDKTEEEAEKHATKLLKAVELLLMDHLG